MSEHSNALAALSGGRPSETEAPTGRVIEAGARNTLAVEQKAEVEPKAIVTHKVGMSGSHQLMLEHGDSPTLYSEVCDYKSIAKITDPKDGVTYCGVTEHFKNVLPPVFQVVEVEARTERL